MSFKGTKHILFSFTLILLLSAACLFNGGPKSLNKDTLLGDSFPSSQMDLKESSVALRVCFALRSFRIDSRFKGEQGIPVSAQRTDCSDKTENYKKEILLSFDNKRALVREKGRSLASASRGHFPSDKSGYLGRLCEGLTKGEDPKRYFENDDQRVQFHFISEKKGDRVLVLKGNKTVGRLESYRVQTNPLEGPLGQVLEKREDFLCDNKKLGLLKETYLYPEINP